MTIPVEPVNTTQAATRLGIAPANVRQAIARGALAAVRVGRDWLIASAEVDRYGRERRHGKQRARKDAGS